MSSAFFVWEINWDLWGRWRAGLGPAPTKNPVICGRGGSQTRPSRICKTLYFPYIYKVFCAFDGPPGCAAPTAFYQVSRRGGAPEPPARHNAKLQFIPHPNTSAYFTCISEPWWESNHPLLEISTLSTKLSTTGGKGVAYLVSSVFSAQGMFFTLCPTQQVRDRSPADQIRPHFRPGRQSGDKTRWPYR